MVKSIFPSYVRLPYITNDEQGFCLKTVEDDIVKNLVIDNYIVWNDVGTSHTRWLIILLHDSDNKKYACSINRSSDYSIVPDFNYSYIEDAEGLILKEVFNRSDSLIQKRIWERQIAYKYVTSLQFLSESYAICKLSSAKGVQGLFLLGSNSYSALQCFTFKSFKVYSAISDKNRPINVVNILDANYNIQRIGIYHQDDDIFEDVVEIRK